VSARRGWPGLVATLTGRTVLAGSWAVLAGSGMLTAYTVVPLAAGWRPAVVTSGSMVPALRPGDVVLFQPAGGHAPAPGTIVIFQRPNGGPDAEPLEPGSIRGLARLVVPRVGLLRLLTTPYGHSGLPWLVLLALSAAVTALGGRRRPRGRHAA
jgi:hypothetical protein